MKRVTHLHRGLVAALALVAADPALAAPCGNSDLLDAFPADRSAGVPTNAVLTAHYAPNAQYAGENVTLTHGDAPPETVDAVFDEAVGLLSVTPVVPLVPGDTYVIKWPGLRGIDTASRGHGATVKLTAGDAADVAAPVFDGLSRVEWDVARERDECTSSFEDRLRFDLTPGTATDDSGTGPLALVVFQTKGPRVDRSLAREQIQTSPLPKQGSTVTVDLPLADAEGAVCFAALVRDLTGKVSSADREACTHTIAPPFFYGCRMARAPALPRRGAWLAPLVLALSFLARRRHRHTP